LYECAVITEQLNPYSLLANEFAVHRGTEKFFLNVLIFTFLTQVVHNPILLTYVCNFSSRLKLFLWYYRWYTTAYRWINF